MGVVAGPGSWAIVVIAAGVAACGTGGGDGGGGAAVGAAGHAAGGSGGQSGGGVDSGAGTGGGPGGGAGAGAGDAAAGDDAGVGTTDGAAGGPPVVCPDPGPSACGNAASIVRGAVSLAPGLSPAKGTKGNLFVALSHYRHGQGSTGGVAHAVVSVPNVDLAAGPVAFRVDMCAGGMEWTEDVCEYSLIAILDTNDNNNAGNLLPDPGEAATRQVVSLSCTGASTCRSAVLDCQAGAACTAYADPANCACGPACGSEAKTCAP